MLTLIGVSVCLVAGAWLVVRLWKARGPIRRLRNSRLDEDGLRATAEAVLAARLARGEIDQVVYARTMQALWGLPMIDLEAASPAASSAPGIDPGPEAVAAPGTQPPIESPQ